MQSTPAQSHTVLIHVFRQTPTHIPNHLHPHSVLLYSHVLCSAPTQFNTVHSQVLKLTATKMPWHLQTPIYSTVHTHTILYTVMCSSLQIPRHHDIYKYTISHTLNCPHPLSLTLHTIRCSCLQIPTANTQNTCSLNYPHPLNLTLYTVMCSCLQRPTSRSTQSNTLSPHAAPCIHVHTIFSKPEEWCQSVQILMPMPCHVHRFASPAHNKLGSTEIEPLPGEQVPLEKEAL